MGIFCGVKTDDRKADILSSMQSEGDIKLGPDVFKKRDTEVREVRSKFPDGER